MLTGTVKWFKDSLGFGYVTPDHQDDEVYVHIAVLKKCGLMSLRDKQRVEFEVTSGLEGKQICAIRLLSE